MRGKYELHPSSRTFVRIITVGVDDEEMDESQL